MSPHVRTVQEYALHIPSYRMTAYLENLEQSGNLILVKEKSGAIREISGKLWFACGVLSHSAVAIVTK